MRVRLYLILSTILTQCFVDFLWYALMFNHFCLPELPVHFKKTLSGTTLMQTAPGLCTPTTTQDTSTASHSGFRKQLGSTFPRGRERMVTLPLFTKRTIIKANRLKTGPNKAGTQDVCNVTHRQSRQNSGWSSSERMTWRDPLLISEEAVFGTSEPQILLSRERTQGRFGCPQCFSSSSVENLLLLRDNLRLSPHERNETTASQSHNRPLRKRTFEAFSLSHCVPGQLPDSSPARKRRKMNFLYYTKVATSRTSQARTRPRRKRTWDTFVLSRYVLRRVRDRSSPARKKMKMSVVYSTQNPQARQCDSKRNSLRKRKWHTFLELHNKSNECPRCTSPKRKKIRMGFFP